MDPFWAFMGLCVYLGYVFPEKNEDEDVWDEGYAPFELSESTKETIRKAVERHNQRS